ncbi:SUMF1/EgtB/PvdO family nonheme iron enzyme [Duganella sp. CY15W]|uniref:formylglycine-generating enzyme family protein n=1 Tax=Duganella sp. CY15W TaxID=2692172 RepID=UPI0013705F5B|nr:SUMF1/EgtB/PvdO family nonheme iron enzyme [Duganella sp. CY15W]MYM29527.1 SUMF1/EgtB/PvdO family nonheme iron enzyme [Duganella sp. CY15W]
MRTVLASSTLLLNLLFAANIASADQAEQMPDGNWRDPAPSAEAIKQLLADTKKNMVPLPAGTFDMGDWGAEVNGSGLPFDGSSDSKPVHKVTLSAFSIGKYPITMAEFDIFTAAQRLPRIAQSDVEQKRRKPRNPAGVNWQGAKDYCTWLAKQSGEPYDLPTEAQWEYAARGAGKRNLYPTNNGESQPGVNLASYEQRKSLGGLVEVGSFPPNPAGLHDFSNGISEWVRDWYDAGYYANSPVQDPAGPAKGSVHVYRGFAGSYSSAMSIKRWSRNNGDQHGTWTSFGKNKGDPDREVPYGKYAGVAGTAFRCALHTTH